MTDGIYTLANDVVYHQLVALLNSIEVNLGDRFPVWIIPYDDHLDKITAEINRRKNVTLLEDREILHPWEDFATQIWKIHPEALNLWQSKGIQGIYRLGMHRRFCAFDQHSPLSRFIFFDGDVLVLNRLDFIFQQLNRSDFVVYDFQHKHPAHVYNLRSERLFSLFPSERIQTEIFCAGCYASQKGLFPQQKRDWLLEQLKTGEAEILYPNAPDQSILNYMTMRSGVSTYNFALSLPPEQRTGCCVTSPHFQQRDNLLYDDKGTRLTYLHYIGIPARVFTRVCAGENLDFPYRDIFLHYRYLHEPEKKPQFTGKPKPYNQPPSLATKILSKLGLKSKS